MSSDVFTVFMHGTKMDRKSNHEEVVNWLSRAVKGEEALIEEIQEPEPGNTLPYKLKSENPCFLICEGPGSDYNMPGLKNPVLNTDKNRGHSDDINPALIPKGDEYWFKKGRKTSEFQDEFMGNTETASKIGGCLWGSGWNDNVYKAAWLITHLKFEKGMDIKTVNLTGWSRGAVTTLMLANKLFEIFEDTIDINIFAVDPVPGGVNKVYDNLKLIPPNVRNYAAILALDENGSLFSALDRNHIKLMAPRSQHGHGGNSDSLNPEHIKPHVHFLPFPGNHSDVAGDGHSCEEVKNSGYLVRHLAWKFLKAHGTVFNKIFDYSIKDLVTMYEQLIHDFDTIADKARTKIAGGHGIQWERDVCKEREIYVKNPDKYINEHHRFCAFGEKYPKCPETEEMFAKEEWTDWNEKQTMDQWNEWDGGKRIDLPKEQDHLSKLGLGI
jgi:hypothetical protein